MLFLTFWRITTLSRQFLAFLHDNISDQLYIHLLLLISSIVFNEKSKNNINFCQDLHPENSVDEAE